MTTRVLTQHYKRLLDLWPADPNRAVSFPSVLRARLAKYESPQSSASPKSSDSSSTATATTAATAATAASTTAPVRDSKAELVHINALYSLVEDRYLKRYPLSPSYLQPKSSPEYYHNLIRELDEAPKRSWLQRLAVRLKGMVRFQ